MTEGGLMCDPGRGMSSRRATSDGFTLIELMIVVVIIGVLAVLAVYGVRKYISNAKSAEARNEIGQMAKDAVTAYARDSISSTLLAKGALSNGAAKLCQSASQSVPPTIAQVTAHKYQSAQSDWNTDSGTPWTGFACLKFSIEEPQYYMYSYTATTSSTAAATVGDTFFAAAQSDLTGNGITSLFQIEGQINSGFVISISPQILEVRPDE
jgi:type IV pilus assembly protein PilA